jgi:hypothetical protein
MQRIIYLCLILSTTIHADTMDHYMSIANNIPQMEMKADQQSQTWARSARTVLILTSESIAETLTLLNDSATQQGSPLFCLPPGVKIEATALNDLIQQTYKEIYSQQSDKDKMTVSQVALIGINKKYPCQQKSPIKQKVAMASAWGQ